MALKISVFKVLESITKVNRKNSIVLEKRHFHFINLAHHNGRSSRKVHGIILNGIKLFRACSVHVNLSLKALILLLILQVLNRKTCYISITLVLL